MRSEKGVLLDCICVTSLTFITTILRNSAFRGTRRDERTAKLKKARQKRAFLEFAIQIRGLDRSGDLIGTQAAGAGVNVTRGTVHNCLYTLDIRFPSSVRSPMGVRNLNSEGYALTADIAFCHLSAPPLVRYGITAIFYQTL